jgi:hypothetical protein
MFAFGSLTLLRQEQWLGAVAQWLAHAENLNQLN